jgi:subtilisin family serine protease
VWGRERVLRAAATVAVGTVLGTGAASARPAGALASAWPKQHVVVGYRSRADLAAALRTTRATVVRRLPRLHAAELQPLSDPARFAAAVAAQPGIEFAQPLEPRRSAVVAEPSLAGAPAAVPEWQFAAAGETAVPDDVLQAAAGVTIAVVDTGADLSAPDLAAKAPLAHDVRTGGDDVRDANGHGTFVASLAAGSSTNGEGMAGFGGEAKLIVVRAGTSDGTFTDVDEAAGIVYAVDHGAKIVNLSMGGTSTSSAERRAIEYATAHGVLLVAAAGNERLLGNPLEYPAALLQPAGSDGAGGTGLSVAASGPDGRPAPFSNTGSYISLAAPGVGVLGAVSALSSPADYPRTPLAGARGGLYGFASGTSFAAPEVAGAAALVWAANPALTAADVARILKQTASGLGTWTKELGYGVIDVGAAVARARGQAVVLVSTAVRGDRIHLVWSSPAAAGFRVSLARDGGPARVIIPQTARTDAWYRAAPGHSYLFGVEAIGADGGTAASSWAAPVRIPRAPASLTVRASAKPRTVGVRASVR